MLEMTPKIRAQIVTHWACSKLGSNEPDEVLCVKITEKLKQEKSNALSDIA